MSFNHLMHPRNPYKDKLDFKILSTEYPEFAKHCIRGKDGNVSVNWASDDAVRELSRVLLLKDFNLDVFLPKGSLVPRVPQKLNYLLWIEDILNNNGINSNVSGIDIGTGSSCIYSLLGARSKKWRFVATDVDDQSISVATQNVSRNGLSSLVTVCRVLEGDILKDVVRCFDDIEFSFCLCNPPFFEKDESERKFQYEESEGGFTNVVRDSVPRAPPRSTTVAKNSELSVEGGEVAFVNRIIDDSIVLQNSVKVYTSMVGKKTSVVSLRKRLSRVVGARHVVSTLNQGKTRRWVLAWTFCPEVSLIVNNAPDSDALFLTLPVGCDIEWIRKLLVELEIDVLVRDNLGQLSCEAKKNTWVRRLKRRFVEDGPPPKKRSRLAVQNTGVQCNLGSGDGRDSFTDAGNFVACERTELRSLPSHFDCAAQAYFPCATPPIPFLVRFCVCEPPPNSTRFSLVFEDGSKQSLCQLLQCLENKARRGL